MRVSPASERAFTSRPAIERGQSATTNSQRRLGLAVILIVDGEAVDHVQIAGDSGVVSLSYDNR
jgi:hypothetical protein